MDPKIEIKDVLKKKEVFQSFDKAGKIYIPKEIREQFKEQYFYVCVEEGKIVLIPVKIEEGEPNGDRGVFCG